MYLPALVAEVALDLTTHARQGVARQAGPRRGIVVVDRFDQAHVPDLEQILVRLRAVLEPADTGPHQRTVPINEDLAGRFPDRVLAAQGMDQVQQFSVVALPELAAGQLMERSHCRPPPANQLGCTAHLCPPSEFQTSAINSARNSTTSEGGSEVGAAPGAVDAPAVSGPENLVEAGLAAMLQRQPRGGQFENRRARSKNGLADADHGGRHFAEPLDAARPSLAAPDNHEHRDQEDRE